MRTHGFGEYLGVIRCHQLAIHIRRAMFRNCPCLFAAEAHQNQHITLKDSNNPTYECGFLLLAMGKLGAKELNYSSDIDFITV